MKKLFSIFALLLFTIPVIGQTSDLSTEDLLMLQERAKQKVDQFNNYISFIAKRKRYSSWSEQSEDMNNKNAYIKEALKLFIGGGKQSLDIYGNVIPAPTMEVSSINRRTRKTRISSRPISIYLESMKNLNYKEVNVTASDAYFASEAKQISGNQYKVTLSYCQWFVGRRGDGYVYRDKTDKTVEVYITREVVDERVRWTVQLGNIKVDATE